MNIYWQNQLSLKVCPNYSYIMNNESIFLRKGDICIILQFLHFLHTASISNQYIAWKLKLFNNFLYRAIIRADDQVLSTYKCTYNGSMRWPSTNKMNSVFSNDSSSSLFFYFSVVVINENYKRSKLVNLKTRGCHYAALVQFQLKM